MTSPPVRTLPRGSAPEQIAPPSADGVGHNAQRPDGILKVTGQFAYGSDLWMDDMIWGATLRSPHPSARIKSIAIGEALATAGVYAVLTSDDVPGQNAYGLEHADQPVLASDVVRYVGEPIALVAADHPEVARRAASKIVVDYEVLEPVTDPVAALDPSAPSVHPSGNLVRHLKIRKGYAVGDQAPRAGDQAPRSGDQAPRAGDQAARAGDPGPTADVVVTGRYEIGMQD